MAKRCKSRRPHNLDPPAIFISLSLPADSGQYTAVSVSPCQVDISKCRWGVASAERCLPAEGYIWLGIQPNVSCVDEKKNSSLNSTQAIFYSRGEEMQLHPFSLSNMSMNHN